MNNFLSAVITGPTGAIGVALCKLLIENGIKVFAVCRPKSKRIENLPHNVNVIECDLSELNLLKNKIKSSVDVFFISVGQILSVQAETICFRRI